MSEPTVSPRTARSPKIVTWLLSVALLIAGMIIYRQYSQAQIAACDAELVSMKAELLRFKQVNGFYPPTWAELRNFTRTQIGYCHQGGGEYKFTPNPDGSVSIACLVHHTSEYAP